MTALPAIEISPFKAIPFLTLMALAACDSASNVEQSAPLVRPPQATKPLLDEQARIRKARAERNRAANAAAAQTTVSAATMQQREFYARAEEALLARSHLRNDHIPQDAPIDAERLTRDFVAIALRDEYRREGGNMVQQASTAPLRRWQDPVRLQLDFGASTDVGTRRVVKAEVSEYASRLSRVTRHPVSLVDSNGNFIVLMLNDTERRAIGPRLAELVPGIPAQDVALLRDLADGNYCTVFAYSRGNTPAYAKAVALVRSELPPRLRSSCFHEELAQGMGLANDSPEARPSIFNDDEEFALLTRHDELLLQILYDPRLRPGMTEAEATPIVRQIAEELLATST